MTDWLGRPLTLSEPGVRFFGEFGRTRRARRWNPTTRRARARSRSSTKHRRDRAGRHRGATRGHQRLRPILRRRHSLTGHAAATIAASPSTWGGTSIVTWSPPTSRTTRPGSVGRTSQRVAAVDLRKRRRERGRRRFVHAIRGALDVLERAVALVARSRRSGTAYQPLELGVPHRCRADRSTAREAP